MRRVIFSYSYSFSGAPDLQNIERVCEFVEKAFLELGGDKMKTYRLQIIVDECFSNICKYSKAAKVQVECHKSHGDIHVVFWDNGISFNPLEQAAPNLDKDVSKRKQGGLGIYLIKKYAKKIEYQYLDGKNCLDIVL